MKLIDVRMEQGKIHASSEDGPYHSPEWVEYKIKIKFEELPTIWFEYADEGNPARLEFDTARSLEEKLRSNIE